MVLIALRRRGGFGGRRGAVLGILGFAGQALEAATSAIVSKLLHPPTVQLKELARNGHPAESLALFRRLMGL